MNKYFEELFFNFSEHEEDLFMRVFCKMTEPNTSFSSWSNSLQPDEYAFATSLAEKANVEYFCELDGTRQNLLNLFVEIAVYYTVLHPESSHDLPVIAPLYVEALNFWKTA